MADYILSPEADQQLDDIWLYSYEKWGEAQADRYIDLLVVTLGRLDEKFVKEHDDIAFGIRSVRCKHHYIFFFDEVPVPIAAVLHERMDLLTRMRELLE